MISERFLEQLLKDKDRDTRGYTHREELKNLLSKLIQTRKNKCLPEKSMAYGALFHQTARSTSPIKDEYQAAPNELPAFFNPKLETIVVKMADNENISLILEKLGKEWIAEPVNAEQSLYDFDLLPLQDMSVSRAWNIVHELRSDRRVIRAEPSWEIDIVAEETRAPETGLLPAVDADNLNSATANKFWAPELIHIQQAWELPLPDGGKVHGEGIRIAHPDTGYSLHHQVWERPRIININTGFDFVGDDTLAFDEDGFPGAGTASVTMSGTEGDILGVAPKVSLIPMRVARKGLFARPAPLLLRIGMRRLRKAIEMAIKTECHVISISHGWLGHAALHEVIQRAWKQNIIIVAAAGNYTGHFVTAPAKYQECIGIAGCNADRKIWKGSARGSCVDFCGPAQDVWKAGYLDNQAIPMQSSGTCFATALTAGVAALWLAYHGREKLIDRYEADKIPLGEVFRNVLNRSADPSPKRGFGGLINAEKALNTPLPAPHDVLRSIERESLKSNALEPEVSSLETTLELMGDDNQAGRQQLACSLGIPENLLEQIAVNYGDELAFHMLLAIARNGPPRLNPQDTPRLAVRQLSRRLKSRLTAQKKKQE